MGKRERGGDGMTKEKLITTPERSKIMSRIRGKNTTPERMLRKALWSHGIRYRKNYRKLPGSPDIAITRYWIAIFVDGDFWHARGHQDNPGEQIKNNKEFWSKNSAVTWNETRITMQPSRTLAGWCFISGKVTSKKIWTVV